MKNFKAIIFVLLVLAMLLCFVGCNQSDTVSTEPTQTTLKAENIEENRTEISTEEDDLEIITAATTEAASQSVTSEITETKGSEPTEPTEEKQEVIELPFVPAD